MYVVIVGQTSFAVELASLLLRENQDKVVLVVKKKDDALRITDEIGINVVNADATKPEVLDDLELDSCDVFIAASDLEKDNVLSSMYAKDAGAKKIFVCVDSSDAERMLKKLGLIPINSEQFAAHAVELMITRPAVSELVNVGNGKLDIIELDADGTKIVGKSINAARGKNFIAIATCYDGDYEFSKDAIIKDSDVVLLVVISGKEKEAGKEIGKTIKRRIDLISTIKASFA